MTLYAIFEREDPAEAAVIGPLAVPERFSWVAFLLPPLFALRHGLILMLLFWVLVVAGLIYASPMIGADAATALYWLIALFLGFEAPAIRRDAMLGRGWLWRGDLISSAADLAERDYLSHRP